MPPSSHRYLRYWLSLLLFAFSPWGAYAYAGVWEQPSGEGVTGGRGGGTDSERAFFSVNNPYRVTFNINIRHGSRGPWREFRVPRYSSRVYAYRDETYIWIRTKVSYSGKMIDKYFKIEPGRRYVLGWGEGGGNKWLQVYLIK